MQLKFQSPEVWLAIWLSPVTSAFFMLVPISQLICQLTSVSFLLTAWGSQHLLIAFHVLSGCCCFSPRVTSSMILFLLFTLFHFFHGFQSPTFWTPKMLLTLSPKSSWPYSQIPRKLHSIVLDILTFFFVFSQTNRGVIGFFDLFLNFEICFIKSDSNISFNLKKNTEK